MDFSKKTKELIERQRRCGVRADFTLNKAKAEELILKTYDLFNLPRPVSVQWCVDIFEPVFQNSASGASSARIARSVLSASSARIARIARSGWSVLSASSALSALSASSAWSARSALDYDFDWYIFAFEYSQNPDQGLLPNENDAKYLAYCELLMEAKEAGLGYCIEWQGTLYLVPTPLVRWNNLNQPHSEVLPAIEWKRGTKFFYLNGVNFPEELWRKVVSRQMPLQDILAIKDIDQRRQAMKYGDWDEFVQFAGAEKIDEYLKFNTQAEPVIHQLWRFPYQENEEKRIFSKEVYFARYQDRTTGEWHAKGVPECKTIAEAMAWGMSDDAHSISPEEWKQLKIGINES